jgi:hypothetical protein
MRPSRRPLIRRWRHSRAEGADHSADPNARRELMVCIWDPADRSPDTRAPYIPGAPQMDAVPEVQSRLRRPCAASWPDLVSGTISSHAADHAPAAKSRAQFPAVIFFHGAGSTGFNYTSLIENLVSRGYVVASIEHTYAAKAFRISTSHSPVARSAAFPLPTDNPIPADGHRRTRVEFPSGAGTGDTAARSAGTDGEWAPMAAQSHRASAGRGGRRPVKRA